jgi:hypothetical protein
MLHKILFTVVSASDNVYQCRWFSPSTPASSTTKTGRHDIAKILLKVALKHQKSNQINQQIPHLWTSYITTFQNIMATSFSGGGSRREPPTLCKQLVNFITCGCESSATFL